MKFYFIDYPRPISAADYKKAIGRMTDKLAQCPAVVSVYQIGSVADPGISDIDILAVFEDEGTCQTNPRLGLSQMDKYLFVHDLFGITRSHFSDAPNYSFFHNYQLLWGEDLKPKHQSQENESAAVLKTQIALEYLIKMFMSLTVQITYGVIKLRSLLLEAKGIWYDLQYLKVDSGQLVTTTQEILNSRQKWFETRPSVRHLSEWLVVFYDSLTKFLTEVLSESALYLPPDAHLQVTPNIRLTPSQHFSYSHKGKRLPSFLGFLGRRYLNIQNYWNMFEFRLPLRQSKMPLILEKKSAWERKMIGKTQSDFINFLALKSSLNLRIGPSQKEVLSRPRSLSIVGDTTG